MKEVNQVARKLILLSVAASVACFTAGPAAADPDTSAATDPAPAGSTFVVGQGFLRNYGQAPQIFPKFWRPYLPSTLALPNLENSPRLLNLIHDGKLELPLADALALTLENNLVGTTGFNNNYSSLPNGTSPIQQVMVVE